VVDRVIEAGLKPRTPKTITSAEKFIKALGATRQRGCAIEDEESEIGMVCIAAPIRDDSGDVVAAVRLRRPPHPAVEKIDRGRHAARDRNGGFGVDAARLSRQGARLACVARRGAIMRSTYALNAASISLMYSSPLAMTSIDA